MQLIPLEGNELSSHKIFVQLQSPYRWMQIVRPDEIVQVTCPGDEVGFVKVF
jgi:hypothetical protein